MNGAVGSYGGYGSIPTYGPGPSGHSWKVLEFKNADVCYWEGKDSAVGSADDLSSYPNEGASDRHKTGLNVACFGGHVEWLTTPEYDALANTTGIRNRLWCNPATTTGH